jgi:hypothetical protein
MSGSDWQQLFRYRGPGDPDYGTPGSVINLWLDNLGGLMLGMDVGDGEKVIVLPLPRDEADDLIVALHAKVAR